MPSSTHSSSVALSRSFTDEGCEQPETSNHCSPHISSADTTMHMNENRTGEAQIVEDDGPSISDILGCSNTRTICGVKVIKDLTDSNSISEHESRSSLSSHTRVDDEGSMDNSQSTHTSASHSTHQTTWNLETKLARSQERRKRLEGRFQRERSKRRSMEDDRDHVLRFVKSLLQGLEEDEKTGTRNQSSQKRISSIREFVSNHETSVQGQSDVDGSSSHDDYDDYDDVQVCFPPTQSKTTNEIQITLSPDLKEGSRPQSPAESVYSSDSSYDSSEAQDEFAELPVKFRSIDELMSCDDGIDDTSTLGFFSVSGSDDREREEREQEEREQEARERDIRHTEEINNYKEQLEQLQVKLDIATKKHLAEMDSMERRFRDESLKREDLLERALTYSEQLEETCRQNTSEISSKQKDLELLAHQHFRKIEDLRRKHREELRKQETVSKENAARHTKEVKHLKELFEEELKKQMNDSNARHSEELKALKKQHEKDLDYLTKIHEDALETQKDELLGDNGEAFKLQMLENIRLSKELKQRDATIEQLRMETLEKSAEFQKAQQNLFSHRSIIVQLEKQRKRRGKELQKARDAAISAELESSNNMIRKLQEELQGRDDRIKELQEEALQSKRTAELEEQLQDRLFEIATLRNEHAQALKIAETRLAEQEKQHAKETSHDALEVQRLKKQLAETEDHHKQELKTVLKQKDAVLESMEARYAKEIRKVQISLDDAKDKYAKDIVALLSKVTPLERKENSSLTRRSSYERRRIEEEYDVCPSNKPRMSKKGKKRTSLPSLFINTNKPASWVDLDSTSPTVSTSCSSLANDFYEDDDRSTSTFGSRSSLPPRHNEVWVNSTTTNKKGGIAAKSGSSGSLRKKRAPKNKLPPSLLDLVGGLVTHK